MFTPLPSRPRARSTPRAAIPERCSTAPKGCWAGFRSTGIIGGSTRRRGVGWAKSPAAADVICAGLSRFCPRCKIEKNARPDRVGIAPARQVVGKRRHRAGAMPALQGGKTMRSHHRHSLRALLLATAGLLAIAPAVAADVTPDRLVNADREPQNWLMNHRTYDAQRYSPLRQLTKANIQDLKLASAVALRGP